jgi:hypothetical protein
MTPNKGDHIKAGIAHDQSGRSGRRERRASEEIGGESICRRQNYKLQPPLDLPDFVIVAKSLPFRLHTQESVICGSSIHRCPA